MSSAACNTSLQLFSSSPSGTLHQLASRPGDAAPFSPSTTHHHSLSPRSTAPPLRKPAGRSKWKTVLAHLAPPHLRLARPAPLIKPPKPCINASGSHRMISSSSFPFSLDVANDVEKLLHIFQLESPLPADHVNKRAHALAALCALCVSSPNNANQCVLAGGVQIIIDVLSNTAQVPRHPPHPAATGHIVEENEKALLLLQLLVTISSSKDACIAALHEQSPSIIATLGKKLLRSSESCTASAIGVLTALARHSDATRKAISETAIPGKLVVVLQVASKEGTKRRAGRLLRLLAEPQQPQQTNDSSLCT